MADAIFHSAIRYSSAVEKPESDEAETIKGLNEMEHAGFTSSVIRGLKAGAK